MAAVDAVERRLWHVALAAVLALSTLKTIKAPMPYAASHYWLTYEQGFVRRGLPGEIADALGVTPTYAGITVFAGVLYALFLLAVWRFSAPLIDSGSTALRLAAILHAAAIGVVYMAGTLGYADHLVVLLAIAALLPRSAAGRAVAALFLGVAAILIHEGALLMFLPATWFAVHMAARPAGEARALALAAGVAAVHAALTLAVALGGTLGPEAAEALRAAMQARADIPPVDLLFRVLGAPAAAEAADTLRGMSLVAHVDSLVIVAPALVPLLALGLLLLRAAGASALTIWLAAGGALAPVLLRFLAKDMHRWDAMAVTAAFLVLWTIRRDLGRPVPAEALDRRAAPVLAAAIAVTAASTTFLVSHQPVEQYPFIDLRRGVLDHVLGR